MHEGKSGLWPRPSRELHLHLRITVPLSRVYRGVSKKNVAVQQSGWRSVRPSIRPSVCVNTFFSSSLSSQTVGSLLAAHVRWRQRRYIITRPAAGRTRRNRSSVCLSVGAASLAWPGPAQARRRKTGGSWRSVGHSLSLSLSHRFFSLSKNNLFPSISAGGVLFTSFTLTGGFAVLLFFVLFCFFQFSQEWLACILREMALIV